MELPRLEPLFKKYQDQGFQVIAIESRRDTERATKFIAENGLSYPCLENGEGDAEFVYGTYNVTGYPTSFLIDADGKVLYMHLGFDEGDEARLAEEIERVLSL